MKIEVPKISTFVWLLFANLVCIGSVQAKSLKQDFSDDSVKCYANKITSLEDSLNVEIATHLNGINADEFMQTYGGNLFQALKGKLPGLSIQGVNFDGSIQMMNHGSVSFLGNNQPLIVIDGIPLIRYNFNKESTLTGDGGFDYGGLYNDINGFDFESVEIIPGIAAAALYGNHARNGAIVLTSKSGESLAKTFDISLNAGFTVEKLSVIPELQNSYGGGFGDFTTAIINNQEYTIPAYALDESWGPRFNGQEVLHWWGIADYQEGKTTVPVTAPWEKPTNGVQSFYNTGLTKHHALSLAAKAKLGSLRFGYTNIQSQGIIPNSAKSQHNFHLQSIASLFHNKIKLGASVHFTNRAIKGRPMTGFDSQALNQQFFQWGQSQLDYTRLKNYQTRDGFQKTWNRTSVDVAIPVGFDNPYWIVYKNYEADGRKHWMGAANITYQIAPFLSLQGIATYDGFTDSQSERIAIGSVDLSKFSTQKTEISDKRYLFQMLFNKTFNKVETSLVFGGGLSASNKIYEYVSTNGGLKIPNVYSLSNSVDNVSLLGSESKISSKYGYLQLHANYNQRVYADFNFRNETFAGLVDALSVQSGGLLLKIELLKLLYQKATNNQLFLFGNYGWVQSNKIAPDYADIKELEFGIYGSLFRKRIEFQIDGYRKQASDIQFFLDFAGASGYSGFYENGFEIQNNGVNFYLKLLPIKTINLDWYLGFNFIKNGKQSVKLPDGLAMVEIGQAPGGGASLFLENGSSIQELYAYNYKFNQTGGRIVENGFYTQGNFESAGSVLPDFLVSLNNTVRFKNFDFYAQIDWSKGGKYYSLTHMWGMVSGRLEQTAVPAGNGNTIREEGVVVNGIIDNGDGTYSPNTERISAEEYSHNFYYRNGTPSINSVFDASYFKLRELAIGYTLSDLARGLSKVKISIFARNLMVWGLGFDGIDPETIVKGNSNIQGLEGGMVPGTQSMGINLQIVL